jgi:hypothetical protein
MNVPLKVNCELLKILGEVLLGNLGYSSILLRVHTCTSSKI